MEHHDQDFYRGLPVTESEEAQANFERYCKVAFDIAGEPMGFVGRSVDISVPRDTMTERSKSNLED